MSTFALSNTTPPHISAHAGNTLPHRFVLTIITPERTFELGNTYTHILNMDFCTCQYSKTFSALDNTTTVCQQSINLPFCTHQTPPTCTFSLSNTTMMPSFAVAYASMHFCTSHSKKILFCTCQHQNHMFFFRLPTL